MATSGARLAIILIYKAVEDARLTHKIEG